MLATSSLSGSIFLKLNLSWAGRAGKRLKSPFTPLPTPLRPIISPSSLIAKLTDDEGHANLKAGAAILVLVHVSSSRVYRQLDLMQLDSQGFDFRTRKIYEFLPVNFSVTLQNSGNVHEKAFGNIFIDWVSGKKTSVGIVDVNQEQSFILPQTTRTFNSSWTDGFPVWEEKKDAANQLIRNKKGEPERKLEWDISQISSFRIGKFNATLLMIYNDGVRDLPS
jgi:hypothetical protein